jgi:hypothetical protein
VNAIVALDLQAPFVTHVRQTTTVTVALVPVAQLTAAQAVLAPVLVHAPITIVVMTVVSALLTTTSFPVRLVPDALNAAVRVTALKTVSNAIAMSGSLASTAVPVPQAIAVPAVRQFALTMVPWVLKVSVFVTRASLARVTATNAHQVSTLRQVVVTA